MKLMHGVKLGFSFSLMLVVSACATLTDESMSGKPAAANNNGVTVGHATNAPTNGGTIAPSYSNTGINKSANSASQSDVIRSLLSTAKKQRDNKQYANATATLDRAVRIAPKDPEPFKQLAEVRFEQGKYTESEQMARKALVLAGSQGKPGQRDYSSDYLADLWDIVAESRSRLGDQPGAKKARENAADLRAN